MSDVEIIVTDENPGSEVVAEIADAAAEIIEENAERAEIAAEVNDALIDAALQSVESQHRNEFEERVNSRVSEIFEGLLSCQNELEQLRSEVMRLSQTATAAAVTSETALETAETSLILQASNPQNVDAEDPASQMEMSLPVNPEVQESQPEPSAPPLLKRIRRLL